MPSDARQKFKTKMLPDVKAMLSAHTQLNPMGKGRRKLGHITKGGVLLLCAAWELYIEEVIEQVATKLLHVANEPKDLPMSAQKRLAALAGETKKDELRALSLAGEGWKIVYSDGLRLKLAGFNTPKSGPVDELFLSWVGKSSLSDCWSHGTSEINGFVSVRGDIAHRGADADYVTKAALDTYRKRVEETIKETDDCLAEYVKDCTIYGKFPWRRTH